MVRISKVRTFIENQIKAVDKKLKAHDDAFNNENISSTKLISTYHIVYTIPSITRIDSVQDSTVSATVTFFFREGKSTVSAFDNGMNKVNEIAHKCQSYLSLQEFRTTDDFPIQLVESTSIIPEPLENNDNVIKITLGLDLLIQEIIC